LKPIIGVTPLFDEKKDSLWMLPGYMEGIRQAGGIPIILPLEMTDEELNQVYELCDGFLFTGGQDFNPARYHEAVSEKCGIYNDQRDELEARLFERAYAEDKSILGICRGLHVINALLGGTLYQDLPSQFVGKKEVNHHMEAPYNRKIHQVHMNRNAPLFQLLAQEEIGVNSYHHQGIKTLGNDLEVMAYAPDGLIEGICSQEKNFIWAVQWHPEFLYKEDENNRLIFKQFVASTKKESYEENNFYKTW
jgi:putative glutamine amidotransferase